MLRTLLATVLVSGCLIAADGTTIPDNNATLNNDPPNSVPAQPDPHAATKAPDPAAPMADDPAPTAPIGAVLQKHDAEFIRCAVSAGRFEIASSQWVLDHGLSGEPAVFARTMISDHQKIGDRLDSLLRSKGVATPDDFTKSDQATLEKLKKTPEDQLGKAYIDDQVAAHQTAVKLFGDEAANGKDADLRAFAAANLDALKSHLAHAQQCQ